MARHRPDCVTKRFEPKQRAHRATSRQAERRGPDAMDAAKVRRNANTAAQVIPQPQRRAASRNDRRLATAGAATGAVKFQGLFVRP